jgi:hypothetical protein
MLVSGDVHRPSAVPVATRRRAEAAANNGFMIILLVVVVAKKTATLPDSPVRVLQLIRSRTANAASLMAVGLEREAGFCCQKQQAPQAKPSLLHEPIFSDPSSIGGVPIFVDTGSTRGRAGRVHNCTERRAWRAVRASKVSFVVASHVTQG